MNGQYSKPQHRFIRFAFIAAALAFCAFRVLVAVAESVQGNGHMTTEKRSLAQGVHEASLTGPWELDIVVSDAPESLEVKGEDNILPHIKTEAQDGELRVSSKDSVQLQTTQPVVITAHLNKLDAVVLTGSGTVKATSASGATIHSTLTGSGNIDLQGVHTPSFESQINGSGTLTASGRAEKASLSITGSGDLEAKALETPAASVQITGSGNVHVNARQSLDASITGSGSVIYAGSPKVTRQITGAGSVNSE